MKIEFKNLTEEVNRIKILSGVIKENLDNKIIDMLKKQIIPSDQVQSVKLVDNRPGKTNKIVKIQNDKVIEITDDNMNEGVRDVLKMAAICTILATGAMSCRKPIEAEPELPIHRNDSTIVKDTITKNPKDTINYHTDTTTVGNPKDTIINTPVDTIKHNMYGDWVCTTLCRANPTFEKDKLHITKDSLTWYTWGRTVASHGDALGYNSTTYYNLDMLPNIDQNDEKKVLFFRYDASADKVYFYSRVAMGGEIIPNKGYVPQLNRENLYCKFDEQSQLLFFGNLQYKPIK